mmetsp:Transcript_22131/g.48139  ORF Transcript_22131/g.48139 Transcript_22131/m.48139 type:complete len:655 (+) Transcript_22131:316-2280(+)|eukprot:CAMPEP_0172307800 /NCGR_PEP_ID=MMETSP1058-20130122/8582_1 /TAXON_ID=83371 /ORGANISM="Detonula confervacea, Strain CCMP 353" /LENGTH=654 /DNA_ID=CAMNT_0013020071 /DNA_START=243 /DNA_END=2207 /DNA_ORIENTATION=+
MASHPDDTISKRVVWVQDEDTLKWVLVELSAEGAQDPGDYDDVRVPLSNKPSSRLWSRDKTTGKWQNLLVEAYKEEQADAEIHRALPSEQHHQGGEKLPSKPKHRGASSVPSVHQKYAMRLSGGKRDPHPYQDTITEEEDQGQYDLNNEREEDGIKYHTVKPSDTFQFICLKYKVSADALRRANDFSGSTLQFPKKLVIPSSSKDDKKKDDLPQQKQSDSNVETVRDVSSFVPEKPTIGSPPRTSNININCRVEEEVKYHWVEPDDSLRWICLKYKVTANDLRLANKFSGSNLKLAPKKLIIPKPSPKKSHRPTRQRKLKSNGSVSSVDSFLTSSIMSTNSIPAKEGDSITNLSFIGNGESYLNLGSQGSGTVGPAPVAMVHLSGARKLFDQMSCDTDSDMDEEEEAPTYINNNRHANGVRYHDVKPSDTVEYLCLKYRLSASALRRANIGLTGRNLQTGPKRLIIPSSIVSNPMSTSYKRKETHETDIVSLTTYDDDTNTIALSDGHSTVTDQFQSLSLLNDCQEDEGVYHDVQPNDTLQGICLQYGISAYELRRANNFRGLNLRSAPESLVIPKNGRNHKKDFKTMTEYEKVQALIANLPISRQTKKPILSYDEARTYLEFNDWNFDQALRNAKVDAEWSSQKTRTPDKSAW